MDDQPSLLELDRINEACAEAEKAYRLYVKHVHDMALLNARYPAKASLRKRPASKSFWGRLWDKIKE